MYSLLKAGVPILRALAGLRESSVNLAFKHTLQRVRESLESGRELSVSLQRQSEVFSPFYVAMVYVGETTGRLEEIFLRLFHHLEFQEEMRGQVKSALRYPIFVIVVMAMALGVINLFVIPQFAKVYEGFGAKLAGDHAVADRVLQLLGPVLVADARRGGGRGGRVPRMDRHRAGQIQVGPLQAARSRSPGRSCSKRHWPASRAASRSPFAAA